MLVSKAHLKGNYKWGGEWEKALFTGAPSRRLFNQCNGDQVLFLINSFAASSENFSIKELEEIESLINNHSLIIAQSELSLFRWLQLETSKI